MGFNRRKVENQRRTAAEKEAATRRATDAQVLEDAEQLITAWNERQAKHCFRRQSARPLGRGIGFCGSAVPRAGLSMQSTCAASTVIRTGRERPDSRAVVSILSARCTLGRIGAALAHKHRRRNARRTSSLRAGRMTNRLGRGEWRVHP